MSDCIGSRLPRLFKRDGLQRQAPVGFGNILLMALRNLSVNRARSILSTLGILIGVASVVTLTSVGAAAKREVANSITALGSNLISVAPSQDGSPGTIHACRNALDMGLAPKLLDSSPSLIEAVPIAQANVTLSYGGRSTQALLVGTSPAHSRLINLRVVHGRSITEQDVQKAAHVIVLGRKVSERIFGSEDPLARVIRISVGGRSVDVRVVGLTERKGQVFMFDTDEQCFLPITAATRRLGGPASVSGYLCQACSAASAKEAVLQVQRFMDSESGIPSAFHVSSESKLLEAVNQALSTMTALLSAIAAISLAVGGIGIMNTQLTSVAEKTREIGIRKSIGASNRHIMVQFLVESVILCLLGGAAGAVTGWAFGSAISLMLGWHPTFSLKSIALAIVFSTTVGILFGIFPAAKASRMDPVRALRYE